MTKFRRALVNILSNAATPESLANPLTDLLIPALTGWHLASVKAGYREADTRKALSGEVGGYVELNSVRWAELNGARLVTNIMQGTRRSIANATAISLREQMDRPTFRRLLQTQVGPTERDANTIMRVFSEQYRQDVADGMRPSQSVLARARNAEQASGIAIRRRARVIERTETRFAQQAGRREGYRQAAAQGLIPPGTQRVWLTGDPCPICADMEGQKTAWDQPFNDFDDPPAHPNCGCTTFLEFK